MSNLYGRSKCKVFLSLPFGKLINCWSETINVGVSVGDISFREKSYKAFLSFKEKKKTIIYSTHILATLPELCSRVLVLDHGKIIFLGDPKEAIKIYRKTASK